MTLIRFTKMHGLGNDFVVIDAVSQAVSLSPAQIKKLADRRFGVGCDQVLIVEPPLRPDVDFRYRIFNSDGGEVEQCGNGARCFAKFVRNTRLTGKSVIRVETACGVIELYIDQDNKVTVNMGIPILEPAQIPFQASHRAVTYPLQVGDRQLEIAAVSMGNPHAVLRVENMDTAPVAELGPLIEAHPRFPNRVNVGFMEIRSRSEIRLRVYERGVGETLACGTGACAAVVAGQLQDLLDSEVAVHLPGGRLQIHWQEGRAVMMTGPATTVFHGRIKI